MQIFSAEEYRAEEYRAEEYRLRVCRRISRTWLEAYACGPDLDLIFAP